MDILTIGNIIGLLLNLIIGVINYTIYKGQKKIQTFALIVRKDLNHELRTINPNETSFIYKNKKYIIPQAEKEAENPHIAKFKTKRFILYNDNNPEPINLLDTKEPLIDGETYHAVAESYVLRMLNRPPSGITWNWKTLLMVGVGVIVLIMILRGGVA